MKVELYHLKISEISGNSYTWKSMNTNVDHEEVVNYSAEFENSLKHLGLPQRRLEKFYQTTFFVLVCLSVSETNGYSSRLTLKPAIILQRNLNESRLMVKNFMLPLIKSMILSILSMIINWIWWWGSCLSLVVWETWTQSGCTFWGLFNGSNRTVHFWELLLLLII